MSVKNLVQCPLITPVSSTATELILGAVSAPYGLPPLDGGILVIADSPANPSFVEFIKYTHRIDNVLYGVSRGQEETAARNWTGVTYVYQALTADQYTSELASKEPVIAPGTTAQYWRGDKTFQDLGTAVRAANLAGLSLATNTSVAATDTILAALGKLQAQVNARLLATANAVSATKLQTARTISVAGDATGSLTFDGTANVSMNMSLQPSGVSAGTFTKVTVDSKGRVTAGAYLAATDVPALDASKITSGVFPDARLSGTYTGVNITGNAETATKLYLRPINVTAADNTNRWTPVYTWTFGGQYNSFSARLWIIGRGNFDTQAEVECRAEYSVNAFGIVDLDMWSVSGVPANLEITLVTDNAAKTATLYFKSPSAWENYSIAIMNEYVSGAIRSTPALVPSTTEPVGNVVRKVTGTTYKRIYTNDYRPFADKLTTSRTISTTGDATWSVSFDGSANASAALTLASSGVAAGTYKSLTVDAKGRVTAGADVVTGLVTASVATGTANVATSNTNTFLNVTEKVGSAVASAGTSTQIQGAGTVTVASDTAGKLTITGAQTITGNAATATKLATARTINGVAFDGTANITVADSTKLPLTGGTLSGDLSVGATNRTANTTVRALAGDGYAAGFEAYGSTQGTGYLFVGQEASHGGGVFYNGDGTPAFATGETADTVAFYRRSVGVNEVVFSYTHDSNNVTFRGVINGNGSGLSSLNASNLASGTIPDARLSGTYTGVSITGNAATATKLATARTIGGVSFDGSANINLPGVNSGGNQSTTGNAATATKLETSRTVALTGDVTGSATFDGSANITITATVQDDSHNHVIGNVDGLLAALNGKLGATAVAADSAKLGGTAAANVYSRANTLGTVSQLNGVPTGAIIERGINANGTYIRLADGTQISYRRDRTNIPCAAGTSIEIPTSPAAAFVGEYQTFASGGLYTGINGTGSLLYSLLVIGEQAFYLFNQGSTPAQAHFSFTVQPLAAACSVTTSLSIGRWY